MTVEEELAPLHQGTTATIRATSLSGIANRYVSLDPGPNDAARDRRRRGHPRRRDHRAGRHRPALQHPRSDARGRACSSSSRARPPSTRARAPEAEQSAALPQPRAVGHLAPDPRADRRRRGVRALRDSTPRRRWARSPSAASDLASLVSNANTAAAAIGDENVALSTAASGLLPGTLRKANTTFVNLRAALDDLDVLVAESKPATKDLDAVLPPPAPAGRRTRGPRSATCARSSARRARTTT